MPQLSARSFNHYRLAQQVPIITTTTLTHFIIKLNYAAIITTETIMVTTTTLTTTVTITTTMTYTTTITTTTTTTTTVNRQKEEEEATRYFSKCGNSTNW